MTDDAKTDTYSEAETIARREAALRNMLATPHKPHKPIGRKTSRKSDRRD